MKKNEFLKEFMNKDTLNEMIFDRNMQKNDKNSMNR